MAWVLRRIEDGAFVADPRKSRGSYTDRLQKAKTFATKESAEREACGNERAITVDDVMGRGA